jgi:hypothetical protein
MGYAVAHLDDFPVNFRRTAPLEFEHKHRIENLHKLFPLAVRHPWLVRFIPRLIRARSLYRIYLMLFMLHAEYLVAEQAGLYARAQGLSGPRYWTWVDYVYRLSTKGVLRTYQVLFSRFSRRVADSTRQVRIALQMGDERVVAHMD